MFLIAAAILLSLIPIFVPNKDVTQDPSTKPFCSFLENIYFLFSDAKKTDPIQLQLAINDRNTIGTSSRRKRELNDSYIGCTFGLTGLSIIRSRVS